MSFVAGFFRNFVSLDFGIARRFRVSYKTAVVRWAQLKFSRRGHMGITSLVRWQSVICAGLMLLLAATNARATALTLTETIDFFNTSPGSNIGTLDVGVNTISGAVSGLPGTDPADYFQLTLPALMGITRVDLTISNYDNVLVCEACPSFTTIAVHDGAISTSGMQNFNFSFSGNVSATSISNPGNPPFLAGPATLTIGFIAPFWETNPSNVDQSPGAFNYRLAYTVEAIGTATPVPEPTSLFLMATGLAGAGARRWRSYHPKT
jgi:hypothetical protein